MIVSGTYSDGTIADLTKSTETTYASQSPSIATVSTDGLVTAVNPGSTQIVINGTLTVPVTATSVADTTLTGSTTITLSPAVSISVSPGWSVVYPGQSEQLTASASNVGTSGLGWSISPAGLGSISTTGLYTAPVTVNALQPVTVTATSVANPAYSATTTVWVSAQPFQLVCDRHGA